MALLALAADAANADAANAAAGAPAGVINVGFFELPPHASGKDGKFAGPAISYFERVAHAMGVTPHYVMLPLARLQSDPSVDMVLYIGKNAQREKTFVFPRRPLLKLRGTVTVRRDCLVTKVDSADDLLGQTVGVYDKGYRHDLMRDRRLSLYEMPSDKLVERGLQMLMLKRIDGFYSPEDYSVRAGIHALGLAPQVRTLYLPAGNDALYAAFSQAAAPHYLKLYEQAFAAVSKRETYEAFLEQKLARAPK